MQTKQLFTYEKSFFFAIEEDVFAFKSRFFSFVLDLLRFVNNE